MFPKDAMGQEAVEFAVHFAPDHFTSFGVFQIPDETFSACLQGQIWDVHLHAGLNLFVGLQMFNRQTIRTGE